MHLWHRGVVVIIIAQLHSAKPDFGFFAVSDPAGGVWDYSFTRYAKFSKKLTFFTPYVLSFLKNFAVVQNEWSQSEVYGGETLWRSSRLKKSLNVFLLVNHTATHHCHHHYHHPAITNMDKRFKMTLNCYRYSKNEYILH